MPPPKDANRQQLADGVPMTGQSKTPAAARLIELVEPMLVNLALFSWDSREPLAGVPYEIVDPSKNNQVLASGKTSAEGAVQALSGIKDSVELGLRCTSRQIFGDSIEPVYPQPLSNAATMLALVGFPLLADLTTMGTFGPGQATPLLKDADRKGARDFLNDLTARGIDDIGDVGLVGREKEIFDFVTKGNIPDFNAEWFELAVSFTDAKKVAHTGKVWIMPDCLAMGSNSDWMRLSISGYTSQRIADAWGCLLPTPKLLRDLFDAAQHKMFSHNIGAFGGKGNDAGDGLHQGSNDCWMWHEDIIQGKIPCVPQASWGAALEARVKAIKPQFNPLLGTHPPEKTHPVSPRCTMTSRPKGEAAAGHLKEVVIPFGKDAKGGDLLTFDGFWKSGPVNAPVFWQNGSQPHPAHFTDYSQGTRFVHPMMEVDGTPRPYTDILTDATLWPLVHKAVGMLPGRALKSDEVKYPIKWPPV